MVEDLDDIIGKLNDQGGFGALLLDDTIKLVVKYNNSPFGVFTKSIPRLDVVFILAPNLPLVSYNFHGRLPYPM